MKTDITNIHPTSPEAVERITAFISAAKKAFPDESDRMSMRHDFHAGMYVRTLFVPAGMIVANDLIKIPTVLIVSGDCVITDTESTVRINGYEVLLGAAARQCVVRTLRDTYFSMCFATHAKTVEEAEKEFATHPETLLPIKEKPHERNSTRSIGGRCHSWNGQLNVSGQAPE